MEHKGKLKIFFVMRHSGSIRFYENVLKALAKDGHEIHIAVSKYHKLFDENKVEEFCSGLPIYCQKYDLRIYFWYPFLKAVRRVQNYLRYLLPEYKDVSKLKERAANKIPRWFIGFFGLFSGKERFIWKVIEIFKSIERALPAPKYIKKILRDFSPDIFLITPLVDLSAVQLDWLKCAKDLNIKTCLCVGSWDNLTNKGLVLIEPDAVIVWNEYQASELEKMHHVFKAKVFVTGAQCFDQWFEMRPSLTREDFLSRVGLSNDAQYLLYLCSSPFICPNEVEFIKKWIRALRGSGDKMLFDLNIVIRPHPQNSDQWIDADFSEFRNVSIYPKLGASPVDESSKNDFFCSMYYAQAVIGVNTSAMIESGILEKPVFTICDDNFRETQEGTLHFRYLTQGGLLYLASDFKEHFNQIRYVFSEKASVNEKLNTFIEKFLRPNGLGLPAMSFVKDSIIKTTNLTKVPYRYNFFVSIIWKLLCLPCALCLFLTDEDRRAIKNNSSGDFLNKFFAPLKIRVVKVCNKIKAALRKIALVFLSRLLKNKFMRGKAIPWLITNVKGVTINSLVLKDIETAIKKIAKRDAPIIAGPWLSEVGFEVLYWIPFLNWACKEYGIEKERLYVVSRGGANVWYKHLSDNYTDIFDYISPEELRKHQEDRINATTSQKHLYESAFDKKIISNAADNFKINGYETFHPLLMYKLFLEFWRRKQPVSIIFSHCLYEMFKPLSSDVFDKKLPEKYIAVKFYFNKSFPETRDNVDFVTKLLKRLSQKHHIVVLESGIQIDDHSDCFIENSDRIHKINCAFTSRNNLGLQTRVLANADMFIGTYGGFSYLPAFYGKPAVAVYSQEWSFLPIHLDVMYRVSRYLKYGQPDKLVKVKESLAAKRSDFIALDVKNIDILNILLGGSL